MAKYIRLNAVRCKKCGTIIKSIRKGDIQTCKCGNVTIDGGFEFLSRSFGGDNAKDSYEELSVYEEV